MLTHSVAGETGTSSISGIQQTDPAGSEPESELERVNKRRKKKERCETEGHIEQGKQVEDNTQGYD